MYSVLYCIVMISLLTMINEEQFGPQQERSIRSAVYSGKVESESPDLDFQGRLIIPRCIVEIHKKHPDKVVSLLVVIVEGANPRDSVAAACYAIALLHGAKQGVIPIEHFNVESYDKIDSDWNTTPRRHWLEKVREGQIQRRSK